MSFRREKPGEVGNIPFPCTGRRIKLNDEPTSNGGVSSDEKGRNKRGAVERIKR